MVYAPKILVVDDSPSETMLLVQMLRSAGYQVSTAANGRDGLARVMMEHPHCLILDVILPEMNGFELCRRLRTNVMFKTLPIIMVSTKNTPLDQAWALRQGANRYLVKPFSGDELIKAIWEVLPERERPTLTPPQMQAQPQRVPLRTTGRAGLLRTLIPRRVATNDVMWASSMNAAVIGDRQARRVYAAIDGQSTIERLCVVTQLSMEQMLNVLRYLQHQRRIQLYEPGGRVIDLVSLLSG